MSVHSHTFKSHVIATHECDGPHNRTRSPRWNICKNCEWHEHSRDDVKMSEQRFQPAPVFPYLDNSSIAKSFYSQQKDILQTTHYAFHSSHDSLLLRQYIQLSVFGCWCLVSVLNWFSFCFESPQQITHSVHYACTRWNTRCTIDPFIQRWKRNNAP